MEAVDIRLFFGIGGVIAALWGVVICVWTSWAIRIGGGRLANGRPITPAFVRFIGVFLAVIGTTMAVLAFAGVLPKE